MIMKEKRWLHRLKTYKTVKRGATCTTLTLEGRQTYVSNQTGLYRYLDLGEEWAISWVSIRMVTRRTDKRDSSSDFFPSSVCTSMGFNILSMSWTYDWEIWSHFVRKLYTSFCLRWYITSCLPFLRWRRVASSPSVFTPFLMLKGSDAAVDKFVDLSTSVSK
jgi:hypothetical protein